MGKVSKDSLVKKSNSLIEAGYNLTVAEQRLILAAMAQVPVDVEITDQETYTVSTMDIVNLTELDRKDVYTALVRASKKLYERSIRIYTKPNSKEAESTENGDYLETRIVQSCKYSKKTGAVRLRFSHDIIPHISQLKSHFKPYRIGAVIKCSSAYAIRLYELLIQYELIGHRTITVDDIRLMFNLGDKYKKIKDFRINVIEIPLKEINQHSDISVKFSPVKEGRTIVAFSFVIQKNDKYMPKAMKNDVVSVKQKPIHPTQKFLDKYRNSGESDKDVAFRVNSDWSQCDKWQQYI